jgi:hypothetical protein
MLFYTGRVIFATVMAKKKTYEELVRDQSGTLVEQIVTAVVKQKSVDVFFEEEDDQQWAIVRVYKEKEDQEMGIRLQTGDKWILQFGYYDEEDEFIELLQPLAPADIDRIPQALQKVMRKVLVSEEGLRVPGALLGR